MSDEIDGLIQILFDKSAREDERDDAAMYLGKYDDDRALNALVQTASNLNDAYIIQDSSGESIAEILVKRNENRSDIISKLTPIAKKSAEGFIKHHKPEWFKRDWGQD